MIPFAVRQFFVKASIEPCPILVAVSGGIDSTALLLALASLRESGFALTACHVNHHLRGVDSAADESFVRDLCARLEIPLHVADGALDEKLVRDSGVEAAARDIRYRRLSEVRERIGARFVATAHQKNDQAETVLMRLLTGSGIAGLRGIHPIRDDGFIRPMLEVSRDDVESYLRECGVEAREDKSNADPRFLRNRIRVLVRELGATESLARVATEAQQQWPLLERAIDLADEQHAEVGADETRFRSWPEAMWLRAALLRRHIRRLDPRARDYDAQRIAGEVDSIRRLSVTKGLELVRIADALVLRRPAQPMAAFELALAPDAPAFLPELNTTMHVRPLIRAPRTFSPQAGRRQDLALSPRTRGEDGRRPGEGQSFQLPENADPRFVVRNRRNGDRFHPLGLAGSKKLKDFLIDRKIAADVRDRIPLLVWKDEIVWVAGVEISERFKVTASEGVIYEVWMEDSGAAAEDQSRFQG